MTEEKKKQGQQINQKEETPTTDSAPPGHETEITIKLKKDGNTKNLKTKQVIWLLNYLTNIVLNLAIMVLLNISE